MDFIFSSLCPAPSLFLHKDASDDDDKCIVVLNNNIYTDNGDTRYVLYFEHNLAQTKPQTNSIQMALMPYDELEAQYRRVMSISMAKMNILDKENHTDDLTGLVNKVRQYFGAELGKVVNVIQSSQGENITHYFGSDFIAREVNLIANTDSILITFFYWFQSEQSTVTPIIKIPYTELIDCAEGEILEEEHAKIILADFKAVANGQKEIPIIDDMFKNIRDTIESQAHDIAETEREHGTWIDPVQAKLLGQLKTEVVH